MRLQEKYEAGWKVGFAKGYAEGFAKGKAEGTIRVVTKMIRAMKDAGERDKEIFDLAHEISDGEIPDEKLQSMIANG